MVIQDTLFVLWLMVAGPLWAVVGMFVLPNVNRGRKNEDVIPNTTLKIAGVIGGFAPWARSAWACSILSRR